MTDKKNGAFARNAAKPMRIFSHSMELFVSFNESDNKHERHFW